MGPPTEPACPGEAATDPPQRVGHNLYCVKCRYNLRMQSADGVCPECGARVAETIAADREAPQWLAMLQRSLQFSQTGFPLMTNMVYFTSGAGRRSSHLLTAVYFGIVGIAVIWQLAKYRAQRDELRDAGVPAVSEWQLWCYVGLAVGCALCIVSLGVRNELIYDVGRMLLFFAVPAAWLAGDYARRIAVRFAVQDAAFHRRQTRYMYVVCAAVAGALCLNLVILGGGFRMLALFSVVAVMGFGGKALGHPDRELIKRLKELDYERAHRAMEAGISNKGV